MAETFGLLPYEARQERGKLMARVVSYFSEYELNGEWRPYPVPPSTGGFVGYCQLLFRDGRRRGRIRVRSHKWAPSYQIEYLVTTEPGRETCDCPDEVRPCKHIFLVRYLLDLDRRRRARLARLGRLLNLRF